MSEPEVQPNGTARRELPAPPSMEANAELLGPADQMFRAEIDVQVATARRYPRSLDAFEHRAREMALRNEETASACYYCLPRDGKAIEGPSIRMTEILAASWTNLHVGARVVGEDEHFLEAIGIAWDLELNVKFFGGARRRITGKYGRYSDDMLVVTGNAAVSIAMRNAILRIGTLRAFAQQLMSECKKVARGDERTLEVRRGAAVDYFTKELGVTLDALLARLSYEATQREEREVKKQGIPDIDLKDLELLRGFRTAIIEGHTTVEQVFASMKTEAATSTIDRATALADELKQATAEPEKAAPAETVTPQPGLQLDAEPTTDPDKRKKK